MKSKLIAFNVPLFNVSPTEYQAKRDKKFEHLINELERKGYDNSTFVDTLISLRDAFNHQFAANHKYNDRLGYVEVYFDNKDILLEYFLNGNQKKRYNHHSNFGRRNVKIIYPPSSHVYGSRFIEYSNSEIQRAILEALNEIEKQCTVWRVFVDVEKERELVKHIDFVQWIKAKGSSIS